MVARGVADGTFAQVDVARVVRGTLSLGIDLVRWYRLDGPDSPEELGEFYAELALRMVTGPQAGPQSGAPSGSASAGTCNGRANGPTVPVTG